MTSVARRPAPYNSPVLVAPPTGVEATDTENIQKAYERLGKSGKLQLRNGTYVIEAGVVKFNKYGVWLAGQGAAGVNAEIGQTFTAGTLITCGSKTGTALAVEAEGVKLSDFGLANNYKSERAHLTETLSTAAGITQFKCSALTEAIPIKTAVKLIEGSHEQFFRTTAEAAAGAELVKVESLKPNFAYPLTTTKVFVETPTAGNGLLTAVGEGKGGWDLRCEDVDIEGFFINVNHGSGLVPIYSNCHFSDGVEYNFKYTNAAAPLGGDLTILGCTFLATKKREVKAHFRCESASGMKITGCKFNAEAAVSPEFVLDFFNQTETVIGIAQITGNSIEQWKKAIRITGIAKGENSNYVIAGNEFVCLTSKATCLEVTHPEVLKANTVVMVGNQINTGGGTVVKLNNTNKVRIGNNNYQANETLYKAEGTNTGFQIGAASEPTVLPATVEAGVYYTPATEDPLGGASGSRDCLVQLEIEPKAGEAVEGLIVFKMSLEPEKEPIKFKFPNVTISPATQFTLAALPVEEVTVKALIEKINAARGTEAQSVTNAAQAQTFSFLIAGQNLTGTSGGSPGKWRIEFTAGGATSMRSVYTYLN